MELRLICDALLGKRKDDVVNSLRKKFGDGEMELDWLLKADPTENSSYAEWLLKNIDISIPPDDVSGAIMNFLKVRNYAGYTGPKNIVELTLPQLLEISKTSKGLTSKRQSVKNDIVSGAKIVLDTPITGYNSLKRIVVVKITSQAALTKFANGTDWCIKDPEFGKSYLRNSFGSSFYLVYIKGWNNRLNGGNPIVVDGVELLPTERVFLLYPSSASIEDVQGYPPSTTWVKFLRPYLSKIDELYDVRGLTYSGGNVDKYFDVLDMGRANKEHAAYSVYQIYDSINNNTNPQWDKILHAIEHAPEAALIWAAHRKKRFPRWIEKWLIEKADLTPLINYAVDCVGGRWTQLENAILVNDSAEDAFEYYDSVVMPNERWWKGEELIMSNPAMYQRLKVLRNIK